MPHLILQAAGLLSPSETRNKVTLMIVFFFIVIIRFIAI